MMKFIKVLLIVFLFHNSSYSQVGNSIYDIAESTFSASLAKSSIQFNEKTFTLGYGTALSSRIIQGIYDITNDTLSLIQLRGYILSLSTGLVTRRSNHIDTIKFKIRGEVLEPILITSSLKTRNEIYEGITVLSWKTEKYNLRESIESSKKLSRFPLYNNVYFDPDHYGAKIDRLNIEISNRLSSSMLIESDNRFEPTFCMAIDVKNRKCFLLENYMFIDSNPILNNVLTDLYEMVNRHITLDDYQKDFLVFEIRKKENHIESQF